MLHKKETNQIFKIITAKAGIREETGYAYLKIQKWCTFDCVECICEFLKPHMSHINEIITKHKFEKLDIRKPEIYEKQPFHDLPLHLPLTTYAEPEDLQEFKEKARGEINLELEVCKLKLVPPTMNGSLTVVAELKFDNESKKRIDGFQEILKSKRPFGWHVSIAQSFYSEEDAEVIFKLNKYHKLNIARDTKEKILETKLKGVETVLETVEKQSTFFKDKLIPKLEKEGFEIGKHNGKDDHIILHKRKEKTFKILHPKVIIKEVERYACLEIPKEDVESIWEVIKPQVSFVNGVIEKKIQIEPIEIREQTHPDQPFHRVPPHISLTVDSDPEDLATFKKEADKNKIELKYEIGKLKIIPPTMNGSLSIVVEMKFDDKSLEIIDGFKETLKSNRSFGWHMTIGQSFYKPKDAGVIYELNRDYKLNIGRSSKEAILETGLERAGEVKDLVDKQTDYFMDTLLPYLRLKGYKIGQYRGKDDHIILNSSWDSIKKFEFERQKSKIDQKPICSTVSNE